MKAAPVRQLNPRIGTSSHQLCLDLPAMPTRYRPGWWAEGLRRGFRRRRPTSGRIGLVTPDDDLLDTSTLSDRQRQVLTVIRDFAIRHGHSPSTREIGDALGLGASTVGRHLRALEEYGFL